MKSAYELAMARLEKEAPSQPLSQEQKNELAELDSRYQAKIAERKVFLEGQIRQALGTSEESPLRRQLASEIARLEEEREDKKNAVRTRRS